MWNPAQDGSLLRQESGHRDLWPRDSYCDGGFFDDFYFVVIEQKPGAVVLASTTKAREREQSAFFAPLLFKQVFA